MKQRNLILKKRRPNRGGEQQRRSSDSFYLMVAVVAFVVLLPYGLFIIRWVSRERAPPHCASFAITASGALVLWCSGAGFSRE